MMSETAQNLQHLAMSKTYMWWAIGTIHLFLIVDSHEILCSQCCRGQLKRGWALPWENQVVKHDALFGTANLKLLSQWCLETTVKPQHFALVIDDHGSCAKCAK
jgi:hypothetical protein